MAAVQTTYNASIAAAVAGLVANMETQNSITRLCEDSSIGFGKAVFQGTADNEVTATASAAFKGITMIDTTLSHDTPDQYEAGDNVAILTDGVIWVEAGDTVAAGEAAYVDGDGNFVESASGATQLVGCTFDSSGADGDLVKLRVRA